MLGAADIESWDDDVRTVVLGDLLRAGWDRAGRGNAPTVRLRRLLARFRAGERLTTRELEDLRDSLRDA
jgi:hypothetical protein